MKRKFFIDTDTASDDAVALIIALRHSDIEVVGIGVVAGNVPLEMGVQNALYTRELCGSNTPIYAGASQPLSRELRTAQFVHGIDGMGDIGLDLKGRQPDVGDAVDELIKSAHEFEGVLELVTLGPLTNIALALQRDPTIANKIKRCVVMGAVADHIGNVTPVAEFNMWVDPEAVEVVLHSGMNLEFVGWDISRKFAVITQAESTMLRAMNTPLATFTIDIQRVLEKFCENETHLAGFDLPDPIAIAYAINAGVADEVREMHLVVETHSPTTEGMVVMDTLGVLHQSPNALVVTSARHDVFMSMLMDALEA
ncbi:MAG: nucleoside hydrolase [Actinobacteria bacterium]|nr:MAG: nucleoside hydrolase [Actinomycetota bacterium]